MAITVNGRQYEMSEKERAYFVAQLTPVYDDPMLKMTSVNAVVQQEKNRFSVNLVLNCKYHVLTAKVEDFDVYKAFDAALQKAQSQIKSLREKIIQHQVTPLSESELKSAEAEALK
ncbi:MAG: ribosome-associated translation inhibitor RaiA [Victivallaceae bacterium]|nr:ribosome-associated translation inhibitor RaiA [Victivallaceae bacterium]